MLKLNGVQIKPTRFPDNTSQVWGIDETALESMGNLSIVEWVYEHEGEFMQLAQLKSLLDERKCIAVLRLDYLPYGRQDKEVSNDTTFALAPFAKLLNSLNFSMVSILDAHSSRALQLINNSSVYYKTEYLKRLIKDTLVDLVVYPDEGALKKYVDIYNFPYIHGLKVRNPQTGNIESYMLRTDGDIKGKNVLIVDDICDGGATFVALAKELKACEVGEINLFVTHGLFTKGLKPLYDAGISRIFSKVGEAIQIDKDVVGHRIATVGK